MSASIRSLTGRSFKLAVVLGSGLSTLARSLTSWGPIPYQEIEDLPTSRVPGHEGALYFGELSGVSLLVFAGRIHLYEGHSAEQVTRWVELAVDAGCDTFILTNAAGALDPGLEVGAPCLISDHLNLTGENPLRGRKDPGKLPFLDLSDVYDPRLRRLALDIDPGLEEGVYAGMLGPTYETPAEVEMLRRLGARLVGMSTVLEAIMARYMGARVLGISVVSNLAAGIAPQPLSHEEVQEAGLRASGRMENLLRSLISHL